MDTTMTSRLVCDALSMATRRRRPAAGLLHHSDRGSQYACEAYRSLLAAHGIAYTHIPVPFDAPTPDHVAALAEALATHPGAVHVHCIMNFRVTAFFYLLDVAAGVLEAKARARMAMVWNPLEDERAPEAWRALLRGD